MQEGNTPTLEESGTSHEAVEALAQPVAKRALLFGALAVGLDAWGFTHFAEEGIARAALLGG